MKAAYLGVVAGTKQHSELILILKKSLGTVWLSSEQSLLQKQKYDSCQGEKRLLLFIKNIYPILIG